MSKYHIKAPDSEHVEGPFSVDQLRELSSAGILGRETLIRQGGSGGFSPLGDDPALWDEVRERPKSTLKLRKPEPPQVPKPGKSAKGTMMKKNRAAPAAVAPSEGAGDVNDMLAAAEGKTEQTRHIQRLRKSRQRAVSLLLPGLVLMLLGSVAFVVHPEWSAIVDMFKSADYSFDILLSNWILLFAITDLILAIGIGLGQAGLFPLLRFRAGLGLGFFTYLFYSRGEPEALVAAAALQAGMFGATICTRLGTTALFVLLGVGGAGYLIWLSWFQGIPL